MIWFGDHEANHIGLSEGEHNIFLYTYVNSDKHQPNFTFYDYEICGIYALFIIRLS